MSNITPSPQSPPPNKSPLHLIVQKRSGFFNFGKVFKSSLLVGLGIFSGYLIITEKPEAGFAGIGIAQAFLSMKDDKDEKREELEKDKEIQQLQGEKERQDLRYQFLVKEHQFQLQLAEKHYQILILEAQNKSFEVNSQVPQLPKGQVPQFNAQQDIPQKQVTSDDLESE